jgi:hypothetical protein
VGLFLCCQSLLPSFHNPRPSIDFVLKSLNLFADPVQFAQQGGNRLGHGGTPQQRKIEVTLLYSPNEQHSEKCKSLAACQPQAFWRLFSSRL